MIEVLGAMAIMIEYPLIAAAIGAVVLGLGRWFRRKALVTIGVIWLLYAAYETGMKQRWLCSGECNIRVDLLLIYPVLLASLIISAVSLFRVLRAP